MAVLDTVHAEGAKAEGAKEEAANYASDEGAGTIMELCICVHILVTAATAEWHRVIMRDGGYVCVGLDDNMLSSHNRFLLVMSWLAHGLWGRRLIPNYDLALRASVGSHVSWWNVSGRC